MYRPAYSALRTDALSATFQQSQRPTTPVHRPQLSEASTVSTSLSFHLSSRNSFASTCYTSDEGEDHDDEDHYDSPFQYGEEDYSVLDDLYDLHNSLPARPSSSRVEPLQTRDSRAAPATEPLDFARLLQKARSEANAAGEDATLDTCFCGRTREEDSIYCSRACSRADSLSALEGRSVSSAGASGSSSSARNSIMSVSSSSASIASGHSSSTSASHYRRVTEEERRRAELERVAAEQRVERTGDWRRGVKDASSSSKVKGSGKTAHGQDGPKASQRLPPRTSSKRAMEPRAPRVDVVRLAPPLPLEVVSESSTSTSFYASRGSSLPFPSSPQPTLCPPSPARNLRPCQHTLDATPRAFVAPDNLHSRDATAVSSSSTPRNGWPHNDVGEDGVPSLADLQELERMGTAAGAGRAYGSYQEHDQTYGYGSGQLGLMMLQCEDDDEAEDEVGFATSMEEREARGAYAAAKSHHQYQHEQQPYGPTLRAGADGAGGGGHTRGKLSFNDLMGIMNR